MTMLKTKVFTCTVPAKYKHEVLKGLTRGQLVATQSVKSPTGRLCTIYYRSRQT